MVATERKVSTEEEEEVGGLEETLVGEEAILHSMEETEVETEMREMEEDLVVDLEEDSKSEVAEEVAVVEADLAAEILEIEAVMEADFEETFIQNMKASKLPKQS